MICPHWILWTPTPRCRLADDGCARCNTARCPADFGPWGAWRSIVGQIEIHPDEFKGLCIARPRKFCASYYVQYNHHEWLNAATGGMP